MASDYDPAEFVDSDFQAARKAAKGGAGGSAARAPSREEVDSKVGETHQKLAELKRIQEELERERAGLEETRRRQIEFQTGREEAINNLTRGLGLLEEAEFATRRDAEQMAKSLADMREALAKVQATNETTWSKESFNVELTRALTAIENARMEWNAARLKYPVLSGVMKVEGDEEEQAQGAAKAWPGEMNFLQMCKMGLALTWPLVAVGLIAVGLLLAMLMLQQPPPHR